MAKNDFREFLFTATGEEIDPLRMTLLEFQDEVNAEMRRLCALAELMECADADEASGELLKSAGAILVEIARRMRRLLDLGFEANRSRSAAAPRRRRKQARVSGR